MWIYTKPRHNDDKRFLVNLDHNPQISFSRLGEHWFVDAGKTGDTIALGAVETEQDANAMMQAIFDALRAGDAALDLNAVKPAGPGKGGLQNPAAGSPTPLGEAGAPKL